MNEFGTVAKITKPTGFGLTPCITSHLRPSANPTYNQAENCHQIEFIDATPLEYLTRWENSNHVFGDNVVIRGVIEWADGDVSFAIFQPQYHGRPAEDREITDYFTAAGWEQIIDPQRQHLIYYNFAFNVVALDAAGRNCYVSDSGLQPFDVILCTPDEELGEYLSIT